MQCTNRCMLKVNTHKQTKDTGIKIHQGGRQLESFSLHDMEIPRPEFPPSKSEFVAVALPQPMQLKAFLAKWTKTLPRLYSVLLERFSVLAFPFLLSVLQEREKH